MARYGDTYLSMDESVEEVEEDMEGAEPSLMDVIKLLKKNQKTVEFNKRTLKTTQKTVEDSKKELKSINEKLKGLESKINSVDQRVLVLEQANLNRCKKEDINSAVKNLQVELSETRQRAARLNNLIVFGIKENDEGELLFSQLLNILLPQGQHRIDSERLLGNSNGNKPRPIRIFCSNPIVKRSMMANLKNLKGRQEFREVSVQLDLTKIQQEQAKARGPNATRAKAKANADKTREQRNGGKVPGADDDIDLDERGTKRPRLDDKQDEA